MWEKTHQKTVAKDVGQNSSENCCQGYGTDFIRRVLSREGDITRKEVVKAVGHNLPKYCG